MSLKERAAKAREAQKFNSPSTSTTQPKLEEPPAPKPQSAPTKPEPSNANPKPPKPKPATGDTANARARQAAGVTTGSRLSRADQQALRRREVAQLSIEIPEHRKIELLEAAADNGRTLKAEVLYRLFGED